MNFCLKCGLPISGDVLHKPAKILGDLLQKSNTGVDDNDLYQTCKEGLVILILIGFGE